MTLTPGATGGDDLAALFAAVAAGRYPPSDGGFHVVGPDRTTGQHAVLAFTGHAVVVTDRTPDQLAALTIDGEGGAHHPDVLRALAGPGGWVGVLDAMLVTYGTGVGGTPLKRTADLNEHPRVVYAREGRVAVEVFADERGLVTVGKGLGARTELGIELTNAPIGEREGRALLSDVLAELPADEPVWASCSPGNARSLRALLAVGFVPVGAEVLLRPLAD